MTRARESGPQNKKGFSVILIENNENLLLF